MASQAEKSESAQDDPLRILATRINSANAVDQDQFACSTQLDIEEPETYSRAMQGPNAAPILAPHADATIDCQWT